MIKSLFSRKKNLEVSKKEREILRYFVDREMENIKVFGPMGGVYQKNIQSLQAKLS